MMTRSSFEPMPGVMGPFIALLGLLAMSLAIAFGGAGDLSVNGLIAGRRCGADDTLATRHA